MKELQQLNPDKLEVRQEAPKEKKKILVAKINPGDGHKVWEFDLKTMEIRQVDIPKTASFTGKKINTQITVKAAHIYCSALNKKNAERKFVNWLKSRYATK